MAVRLADPLSAVWKIIYDLPDTAVPVVALGRRLEGDPPEIASVQSAGGPRQRGYSSKSRMQIQVVCYAYTDMKAWEMSEAVYERLNKVATERVDYADSEAVDATVYNRYTRLLSILAADSPRQGNLADEALATCQSTYTVLYDSKEGTPYVRW